MKIIQRDVFLEVYAVLGHVNRPGVIEVPMGVTLREIIYDYAEGMSSGNFKMTQIGRHCR